MFDVIGESWYVKVYAQVLCRIVAAVWMAHAPRVLCLNFAHAQLQPRLRRDRLVLPVAGPKQHLEVVMVAAKVVLMVVVITAVVEGEVVMEQGVVEVEVEVEVVPAWQLSCNRTLVRRHLSQLLPDRSHMHLLVRNHQLNHINSRHQQSKFRLHQLRLHLKYPAPHNRDRSQPHHLPTPHKGSRHNHRDPGRVEVGVDGVDVVGEFSAEFSMFSHKRYQNVSCTFV
jgi:hypothetical protein